MDEHTMKLLLRQQQQLLGNAFNADAANLLPQQSIIQQQTNFAAAMTNTMCTTGASSNHTGGDIGLGTFTQNDRITPPLPHAQQLQRQQQQQQQLLLQSQQQQQLSHMPSSSTAAANNNLFAGIDPTQMMHLPQSSQNTILQRQYQATADRIAEEHKARAIQIAGQRVNGAAGTTNNANANAASSGGTAHHFLQSLQNDTTTRGLHANIANANNATTNDALLAVDMDAEADVDASDPLMASLQMYSQYGEDSTPLAVNAMGGGGAGNHFSNGHNGQLQTNNNNNNMYGGNGFGALSTNNGGESATSSSSSRPSRPSWRSCSGWRSR